MTSISGFHWISLNQIEMRLKVENEFKLIAIKLIGVNYIVKQATRKRNNSSRMPKNPQESQESGKGGGGGGGGAN